MRMLIAIMLALCCSVSLAGEVGIPTGEWGEPAEPLYRHREPCRERYEWRQRVLRRYWVRLPCGRLELWEDVLHYKTRVSY